MNKKDGMNYIPQVKTGKVCNENEFYFAAMSLDHGHIYAMCEGLIDAGATLKYVYDKDRKKAESLASKYKNVIVAASEEEILEDETISLVAAAAVTNLRGPLGVKIMKSGKDYFTDKAPFTTIDQLNEAKKAVKDTGRKFMVYYSERLHVESAIYAGQLIKQGLIGRVIQTIGLGPHKLSPNSRPDWFFEKKKYGGILCDIGSHQIEQFLYYTGAKDATIVKSQIANYNNPQYPELEDFGDALLVADNGATGYFRVDWFTPNGLSTWGDGRTFILGTEGYIELRKYVDIATSKKGDQVYLVNKDGEQNFSVSGEVGCPFFGELILDCINRTEKAMTQDHAFKAAELCILAEERAIKIN